MDLNGCHIEMMGIYFERVPLSVHSSNFLKRFLQITSGGPFPFKWMQWNGQYKDDESMLATSRRGYTSIKVNRAAHLHFNFQTSEPGSFHYSRGSRTSELICEQFFPSVQDARQLGTLAILRSLIRHLKMHRPICREKVEFWNPYFTKI